MMKRNRLILIALGVSALLAASVIVYLLYHKPHEDYSIAEADYSLTPQQLYEQFLNNQSDADLRYNGKVIEISGIPDAWEEVDSLTIAIFIFGEGDFGPVGIRATFLGKVSPENLQAGAPLTIKGFCSGYNGEDVILEQCTLLTPSS
jgi:hypothetical protein